MTTSQLIGIAAVALAVSGLAVYMEKTRQRLDQAHEWERRLRYIFFQVIARLNANHLPTEKLLEYILEKAKELTQSSMGYVAIMDREKGLVIDSTLDGCLKDNGLPFRKSAEFLLRKNKAGKYPGLLGHSLNSGRPFFTNAPEDHSAFKGLPRNHHPISNLLTVPVMDGRDLMGQIALGNKPGGYSEKDLETIVCLGDLLALTLNDDRKRKALNTKEALYKSLFDTINEGVMVMKPDGRDQGFKLVAQNSAARQMGMASFISNPSGPAEISDRDEDLDQLLEIFKKVHQNGKPFKTPLRQWSIRNARHWRQFEVFRLPTGEIVSICKDETEKKNGEIERADLFNLSPDMLAIIRFDGFFKQVNPAWQAELGWELDALKDKPYMEYVHFDDLKKTIDANDSLKKGNALIKFKNRFKHRDGSYRWLSWSAYPHPEQGLIFAVARDITSIVNAQKAVEESREQLSAMFKAADSVAFYITDGLADHPIILEFSPGAEKIFGYAKHTVIGSPVSALHTQDRFCDYHDLYTGMRVTKKGVQGETRLVRQGGDVFPAWFSTYPLIDNQGNMYAVLNVAIDLSETKLMEAKVNQAQKLEALGTMAGGIAHDFNNILSVILGFTEIAMRDSRENRQLQEDLKDIYDAGIRARDLIQQILTFSRESSGENKPFKPYIMIKESMRMLTASLPSTIEIISDLRCKLPIMGNPTQFHQIIMNLATNAAHAMKANGGRLEIVLEECNGQASVNGSPQCICLTVSDTGHGIKDEHLPKIFDPFFTTKGKTEGTGLGLSVIHGIVESMGGEIDVSTRVGKGTRFRLYFPMLDSCRSIAGTEKIPPVPAGSGHIFYVDDEAKLAYVGQRILESIGYTATVMTDSEKAWEELNRNGGKYDAIICDLTMPGVTGDKLIGAFKEKYPDIPAILCTGSGKTLEDADLKDLGIAGVIHKPVIKNELAAKLNSALAASHKRRRHEAKGTGH